MKTLNIYMEIIRKSYYETKSKRDRRNQKRPEESKKTIRTRKTNRSPNIARIQKTTKFNFDITTQENPISYHCDEHFSPGTNNPARCDSTLLVGFLLDVFNSEYDTEYQFFDNIVKPRDQDAGVLSTRKAQMDLLIKETRLVTGDSECYLIRFIDLIKEKNPLGNIAHLLRIMDFIDKRIDENHNNYTLFQDTESDAYKDLNDWREYLLPLLRKGFKYFLNSKLKHDHLDISRQYDESNDPVLNLEIRDVTKDGRKKVFIKPVNAGEVLIITSQEELLEVFQSSLTFSDLKQCYLELRNVIQTKKTPTTGLIAPETTHLSCSKETKKRALEVDNDIASSNKKQRTSLESIQISQPGTLGLFGNHLAQPAASAATVPAIVWHY